MDYYQQTLRINGEEVGDFRFYITPQDVVMVEVPGSKPFVHVAMVFQTNLACNIINTSSERLNEIKAATAKARQRFQRRFDRKLKLNKTYNT